MKTPKFLFAMAAATLALAHLASAQVPIYVSGAPATRKIWNEGLLSTIKTLTTASGSSTSNITTAWTVNSAGTSYDNANQIIISGGVISGTAVTIYGSWAGSTSGNQAVAATSTNALYDAPFINSSYASTSGSLASSATAGGLQYPQLNLSDTYQTSLPFNGTTHATTPPTSYDTLTEATSPIPAVTGFEFIANKNAPPDLTNLTTDQAYELFYNGNVPLALITGSAGDASTTIYAIGRDIGSGSRYILLAETGIGTANSNDLTQYTPAITSGTITNISNYLSSSGTINQIGYNQGNGGYSSTSQEESTLEASSSNSSVGYVIGYLTDSDAATVSGATGQTPLSWNGVPYSVAAIENGSYTYWSFLHVYYDLNHTPAGSLPVLLGNALSTDLKSDPNTGAIFSSNVKVSRVNGADGGAVTY